jgi:hypothetical protein
MHCMDIPIACTLSEAELRERQSTILRSVRENVLDVTRTADGYEFRFTPSSEILMSLTQLVDLERQCCAFLTFRICVEPQQPIRLEIASPPEARAVMDRLFDLN